MWEANVKMDRKKLVSVREIGLIRLKGGTIGEHLALNFRVP